MAQPAYRRVIVKVSGEAFSGPNDFGIHAPAQQPTAVARKAEVMHFDLTSVPDEILPPNQRRIQYDSISD